MRFRPGLFLLVLSVNCHSLLYAQPSKLYQYEPSVKHPYGVVNPKAPEQIRDFAALVGNSQCQSTARNPDGTWQQPEAILWRYKYIMNGLAIQDETLKPDGSHSGSIRQYLPDEKKWFVHYYSSSSPTTALPAWSGNKTKDGNIILYREQKAPNGMEGFYRITFFDISDAKFEWKGEWVDKEEKIVYPTWKISCKKKV
ncbi:hypothetical protein [Aliiglaciecola sp. M165]|uniref:hypothetical protein n=1 Tax=Aliiglaciecola sp. M165 TaxID=2593649 RepID=UPI001C8F65EF|nr:hypothetical protein [Aliiglaciecola sp. M165]